MNEIYLIAEDMLTTYSISMVQKYIQVYLKLT